MGISSSLAIRYRQWIDKRYPTTKAALGRGKQAVCAMKEAFPELRITIGFILHSGAREPQPHWWLVAHDGYIVDPTAVQFSGGSNPCLEYRENKAPAVTH